MLNGIINVYKERGYTSHDVVAKLRGILKQKKIGHTGTLDPEAEGVLPVCLGRATRLCDLLTEKDKTYETVLHLGIETDTQDRTGTVLAENEAAASALSEEQVRTAVSGFLGTYAQIPPMYSALKVNGKKLYELARQGIEVERKARQVQIYAIDILDFALPEVKLRVRCSKGTYIRTLCHDIGQVLGCGGCMESLLRTDVERFSIAESHKLEEITDAAAAERFLIPIDAMFESCPAYTVRQQCEKWLYNGNAIQKAWILEVPEQTGRSRLYDEKGQFVGLYQYDERKEQFQLEKMFLG